jgi:hypothetical protein
MAVDGLYVLQMRARIPQGSPGIISSTAATSGPRARCIQAAVGSWSAKSGSREGFQGRALDAEICRTCSDPAGGRLGRARR